MHHKVVFCFYTNDHEVNLGIGFISAALKQRGVATDLVIYRDKPEKQIDTPESVAERILAKNPSMVAFSVMTFHWRRVSAVISLLRRTYKGPIVVGGYQAILSPEDVLRHPGVDGVCVGEGEQPLLEAVMAYPEGNGSAPRIRGMVFRNQDDQEAAVKDRWLVGELSEYPFIDYDIFNFEGEKRLEQMHIGVLSPGGVYSLPVITGRGCPYRCTYCCNSALIDRYGLKSYLRRYQPETAIANIKGIVKQYSPKMIEFFDETFIRNIQWVKDFCALYKKDVGLPFMIMARIDSLDENLISIMAESGLKLVLFGLESGDEEYRKRHLNRRMSDRTIKEGARLLRKFGIMIVTFNMFGMPFETKETMEKTFELNAAIEPDAAYSTIFQPLPGTELARVAYEHNMASPPPEGLWDLNSPSLDTQELPASYVSKKLDEFRNRFSSQNIVQNYYSRLQGLVKTDTHD